MRVVGVRVFIVYNVSKYIGFTVSLLRVRMCQKIVGG